MKNIGVIKFKVKDWTRVDPNYKWEFSCDGENRFFISRWEEAIQILYGSTFVRDVSYSESSFLSQCMSFEYNSDVDMNVVNNFLIYKAERERLKRLCSSTGGISISSNSCSISWRREKIVNLGPPNRKQRRSHFNPWGNKQQWYNQFNVRSHWLR